MSIDELVGDSEAAQAALKALSPELGAAFAALAEQSVRRGIDYAKLGLNWDHPQSRLEYRQCQGTSFAKRASQERQALSQKAMLQLAQQLVSANQEAQEQLLIAAFCQEIGAPGLAASATITGVVAALAGELLLPLRALNEGVDSPNGNMQTTFGGSKVPRAPVRATVDALSSAVLAGSFAEWRYTNPVGRRQLEGLSDEQIAQWREPSRTSHGGGLVVHEDAPGELGFFWATKIGGPSHGFDLEGQCLLPLLCNARHKVLLFTDPAWPHNHPVGRAHFRLLWVAGSEPPKPVLWLETVNVDFSAGRSINSRGWLAAGLAHAVQKADAMGVALSVEGYHSRTLSEMVGAKGAVREVRDALVLRPSNGVVEASDYLTNKHDWVQLEEEITPPLRRALYEPQRPAQRAVSLVCACVMRDI